MAIISSRFVGNTTEYLTYFLIDYNNPTLNDWLVTRPRDLKNILNKYLSVAEKKNYFKYVYVGVSVLTTSRLFNQRPQGLSSRISLSSSESSPLSSDVFLAGTTAAAATTAAVESGPRPPADMASTTSSSVRHRRRTLSPYHYDRNRYSGCTGTTTAVTTTVRRHHRSIHDDACSAYSPGGYEPSVLL